MEGRDVLKTSDLPHGTLQPANQAAPEEYSVAVTVTLPGTLKVQAGSKKQAVRRLAAALRKGNSIQVMIPTLGAPLTVSAKTAKVKANPKKTHKA